MSETVTAKPHRTRSKRAPKTGQLERTRAQVISAAAELLQETGFTDLTVEQVSKRSGVARSTIYRHWDNIGELGVEAFDAALGPNPAPPDQGDIRSDLVVLYRRFVKILRYPIWRTALPSLIEASMKDKRFEELLNRLVDERRDSERIIFIRAIERGEIEPDARIEWALDAITGAFYHRLLLTGADTGEIGMVEWLVDAILAQMLVSERRD